MNQKEIMDLQKYLAEQIMHWKVGEITLAHGACAKLETKEVYCYMITSRCDDPRAWAPVDDLNQALELLKAAECAPWYLSSWQLEHFDNMYRCNLNYPRVIQTGWSALHPPHEGPFAADSPAKAICLSLYQYCLKKEESVRVEAQPL